MGNAVFNKWRQMKIKKMYFSQSFLSLVRVLLLCMVVVSACWLWLVPHSHNPSNAEAQGHGFKDAEEYNHFFDFIDRFNKKRTLDATEYNEAKTFLQQSSPQTRGHLAITLAGLRGKPEQEKKYMDLMTPYLHDPSSDVRLCLAMALSGMSDPRAKQALMSMASSDPDVSVSRTAKGEDIFAHGGGARK